MIKAIFIDVDNTLLDFEKCSEFAIKSGFSEIGIECGEDIFALFHKVNDSLWESYERGEITKDGIFGHRWIKIFGILNIDFDGFEFEKKYRFYLDSCAEKIEGASELCEYLSGKYELYAASNAAEKQQLARLEKSGLLKYMKAVFTSERIGYSKPNREFFDACLELSGKKADEVILIGDSISADIKGGISAGIETIWFDRKKSGDDMGMPDHKVSSLMQIKNII